MIAFHSNTDIWSPTINSPPEVLKNGHNFLTLHPILKTLTPLESSQLAASSDMYCSLKHYQSKVGCMSKASVL